MLTLEPEVDRRRIFIDVQQFQQQRLVEVLHMLETIPESAVRIVDESAKSSDWQCDVATYVGQQLKIGAIEP